MSKHWPYSPLRDVLAAVIDYRGKAPPKSDFGVPLITARNVRPGQLDFSHKEFIEEDQYDSWMNRGLPAKGDILFTTEAPLGNVCMFPAVGKYALGQRLVTLRPKRGIMDCDFLCQYLLSGEGQEKIAIRSTGSTAKGIKSRELVKISVPVPPLSEQRKIAGILGTWEGAIRKSGSLLENKQKCLTGVSQNLFGRAGAFPKSWELRPLSEIVTRVRRQNGGGNHPVMTISAKSGFLLQSDKFARDMAGRSVEHYTLLRQGEFAYNKGNSQTAPYGCIFPLDRINGHNEFRFETQASQGSQLDVACFRRNAKTGHEARVSSFCGHAVSSRQARQLVEKFIKHVVGGS